MKYVVDVNGERIEAAVDAGEVEIDGERVRTSLTDVEGTPVQPPDQPTTKPSSAPPTTAPGQRTA